MSAALAAANTVSPAPLPPVPEPDAVPPPEQAPPPVRAPGLLPPGVRYMVLGAFWFSVMSLLVKTTGQRISTREMVMVRAFITLALSYWALRRAGLATRGNRRMLLTLRGLAGFGALNAFYYTLTHLPLADASVIQYTNPIFAALLAAFFLREPLGWRQLAMLGISVVGVLLIARPSFFLGIATEPLPPLAVGIGLAGALCSATAYVMVRSLRSTEHPLVIVYYFALVSSVVSVPLAIPGFLWPTPREWLLLLGIGVSTQLGQIFLTRGLHLEPAGRATAIGYLQVVFAATWGILFFAEIPDAGTLLGAALIIGSTLALARQSRAEGVRG